MNFIFEAREGHLKQTKKLMYFSVDIYIEKIGST